MHAPAGHGAISLFPDHAEVRYVGIRIGSTGDAAGAGARSEEHTSELQSRPHLVCRLLLEKKKPYLILQVLLPLRHWAIKGDVLWTEEGHRLSWRMMLRARGGEAEFKVVDKKSGDVLAFSHEELLNKKQRS